MSAKIKNPLQKRIFREIAKEKAKYLAIFSFIVIMIGVTSGIFVASKSMMLTYDNGIEKYNLEDGHFSLATNADITDLNKLNEDMEEHFTVYEQAYFDYRNTSPASQKEYSVRIYANRSQVNTPCVFEGTLPSGRNEIALDRLFSENNNISLGDSIYINNKEYTVCAFIALPDYNCLFEKNTDLMFNASLFTIALISDEAFKELPSDKITYSYTYTFDNKEITDRKAYNASDELLSTLLEKEFPVTDFVKRQNNQAINFAREDMGGDTAMLEILLYVIIAVLAFIFILITGSTIEKEASAIGTLRASGYTRRELLLHYMTAPLLATAIAAILGNILGYTIFKEMAADLYYHSYSLAVYETYWSADAFIKSTVVPLVMMTAINFLGLSRKLRLSPLEFLRHELSGRKKKKVTPLPNFKFFTRFRLRVLLQNASNYFTMAVGIILANILFMFAISMLPAIEHYSDECSENSLANYQYVLKAPVSTDNEEAERYAQTTLLSSEQNTISIYGICENSQYLKDVSLPKSADEVIISEAFLKREQLAVGDMITLKEEYGDKEYSFKIAGTFYYPAAFAIVMNIELFNETFDKDDHYFNGYFSSSVIDDIDQDYIAVTITAKDLTKLVDQLNDSMGGFMPMMRNFSIILYVLVVFLLSKIVLEKNAEAISLSKVLGYNNREIGQIYIVSTAIAVLLALLISIPIADAAIKSVFRIFSSSYSCWIEGYISPVMYAAMVLTGIVCYGLISLYHIRKIHKIPMEIALKNME